MSTQTQPTPTATFDKTQYKRVQKKAASSIYPNEIRITSKGKTRNYIAYATLQLRGSEADDENKQEPQDQIVLKGMGLAISKTVSVAEVIRRRVPNLYQLVEIGSVEIEDEWEPLEEEADLPTQKTTRSVTFINITLSKTQLDRNHPGYHDPLPEEQVKSLKEETEQRTQEVAAMEEKEPQQQKSGGGKGGRRGGRRGGRGRRRQKKRGNRSSEKEQSAAGEGGATEDHVEEVA